MNEEEIVGSEPEKQEYRDQLKRMSRKLLADYEDEIKKMKFLQDTYPHFTELDAVELHSSGTYASFYSDFIRLTDVSSGLGEPSTNFLNGWLKSLKQHMYELRTFIHKFEEREDIHYEIALAKLLSLREKNSPEQVAPKHLQGLPNIGSIGGKKRTRRTKRKKHLKKSTRKKK